MHPLPSDCGNEKVVGRSQSGSNHQRVHRCPQGPKQFGHGDTTLMVEIRLTIWEVHKTLKIMVDKLPCSQLVIAGFLNHQQYLGEIANSFLNKKTKGNKSKTGVMHRCRGPPKLCYERLLKQCTPEN